MKNFNKTRHAEQRCSQRAISDLALQLLEHYGQSEYQKGGTYRVWMSRKERQKLVKAANEIIATFDRDASPYYVVDSEEKMITAGWNYKSYKPRVGSRR